MRVENKSFMMGEDLIDGQIKNYKKAGNIFAGNLKIEEDPIIKKKKEAQEKAMKVISDTFVGEQKIDNDLKNRASHIDELRSKMKETEDEIDALDQEKLELKEKYKIADDSREAKDLELLEKRRQSKTGKGRAYLTKEDKERLVQIDEQEITDYQKRTLEINTYKDPLIEKKEKIKNEIKGEIAVIDGINRARLKSEPMLKADQEAESITDAASDEIVGMLIEESKEHIDEENDKKEEELEKVEADKEKDKDFVEDVKEKVEEMEQIANPEVKDKTSNVADVMENVDEYIVKLNSKQSEIQSEIEKIVDKMKLIMEDLKGAVVDSKL